MRTIKRYSNRKLYDTGDRHYVTLMELARLVRAGQEIHVQDYVTGADLTAQTLAQIIFEEERKAPTLSVAGLTKAIRQGLGA